MAFYRHIFYFILLSLFLLFTVSCSSSTNTSQVVVASIEEELHKSSSVQQIEEENAIITEPTEQENAIITEPTEQENAIITEPTEQENAIITEPTGEEVVSPVVGYTSSFNRRKLNISDLTFSPEPTKRYIISAEKLHEIVQHEIQTHRKQLELCFFSVVPPKERSTPLKVSLFTVYGKARANCENRPYQDKFLDCLNKADWKLPIRKSMMRVQGRKVLSKPTPYAAIFYISAVK